MTTINYACAGDSLTAGAGMWLEQMADPGLAYIGGYSKSGYTSAQVLAGIGPVPDADVLVVMLGTNDIRLAVPQSTVSANIEAIVEKVGAKRVLLCFLPPSDYTNDNGINRRVNGITMNRTLVNLAAKHGWMYCDPFAFQRGWDNAWGTGASTDKTHPTYAVSTIVADRMELYIRQAVEGARLAVPVGV